MARKVQIVHNHHHKHTTPTLFQQITTHPSISQQFLTQYPLFNLLLSSILFTLPSSLPSYLTQQPHNLLLQRLALAFQPRRDQTQLR